MLAYQIRIALMSLRRTPVLSALLVGGIGLGIAVSTAFVTTYYIMAQNPIPEKSDVLHYVQIDSWNPEEPWDEDNPEEPPDQLTWQDAMALQQSDIPTYKSVMYKAFLTVHPESDSDKPYQAMTRMTYGDFFPMFDVPFAHGGGWGRSADEGPEPVVVISHETNDRLFGGENSVGRTIRIEDRDFTVVGVMEAWQPLPKFYDITNFQYQEAEEIYVPIQFALPMEIWSGGNDRVWKYYTGNTLADQMASESIWLQYWVQLDSRQQKEEYLAFLDAYVLEQQQFGRLMRPVNNRLRTVMEWMDVNEVVPDEAKTLLIIAILFLTVCSVNLIGLLLGKFLARANEVGVRRALGASKLSVFLQHIVECEVIGVLGGLLGVGLSVLALEGINRLFTDFKIFRLDGNMILAGIFLSLVAGLVAGIYPAWRICRIPPATHLKLQ
jgi:putative ABC transport system permease protein